MTASEPTTLYLDAMATRFEVVLYGAEPSRLRAAGEDALAEIAALEKQLSRYRTDSDIGRINALAAHEPVKVDARLFCLLQLAVEITRATSGAFDITVAALMDLWKMTAQDGRVPTDDEVREAREQVGAELIFFDKMHSTISFDHQGVQIDLGAIGKGYAIDRAVESLRESGVKSALIHGGTSTIYAIGVRPNGRPWSIGIRDPATQDNCLHTVELQDNSLSVSAPHGRYLISDSRDYGHVIDPRTGQPAHTAALAAIWGPDATHTDALATALLVSGDPGLDAIRRAFDGYDGLVVGP